MVRDVCQGRGQGGSGMIANTGPSGVCPSGGGSQGRHLVRPPGRGVCKRRVRCRHHGVGLACRYKPEVTQWLSVAGHRGGSDGELGKRSCEGLLSNVGTQ
jgi:hypothetical protein